MSPPSVEPEKAAPRLVRMTVSNYRSIGEAVSIDFEPLTVLVGINGSGKSNLLDAPRFIAEALTNGLQRAIADRFGFDSLLRDVGGPRRPLSLQLDLEDDSWTASYHVQIAARSRAADDYAVDAERLDITRRDTGDRHYVSVDADGIVETNLKMLVHLPPDPKSLILGTLIGHPDLREIVEALQRIATYAPIPRELRPARERLSTGGYLDKHGENWPDVLRRVMAGPAARDMRLSLERITGDIDDIESRNFGGGYRVVRFEHFRADGGTRWFEAARESDGTLRIAAILTALVQQPPLTLVGIEEPELAVHVAALPLVMDYLDQASRSSRVVVTTHSTEFLDFVPVSSIRVVERLDGTTRVARMDEGQLDLVKQRLTSPGELLRSQGLFAEEP